VIGREAHAALGEALGDRIEFDAPMSRLTSLRVGGPADAVATPTDRRDLARLLSVCAAHRVPHTVVGGGFNTLVLDGGLDGVVVQLKRFRRLEERPGGRLRAEAGVSHASVTRFCATRGLSGLEFAAGIPGTVGGWVAMNAGIGAREVVDVVRELEVVTPTGRKRSHLSRDVLHFTYRALRGFAPGSVIVSVLLAVSLSEPGAVRAEVDRLLASRAETQPITVPSCGSVFRNPRGDRAGRLIEAAGLKGREIGGAQISPVHANFIVNTGGATAKDVVSLIRLARDTVERTSGIRLEPEVKILGRPA
jgi:UDP-N-acetylmuramate dehydrogenase